MRKISITLTLMVLLFSSCNSVAPPKPVGALPSERHLNWYQMEYYAFVHFNMNTFTDMEWGTGGESPATFNPTALDCRQWAKVAKEAGMTGIILTAKHHDGFCLWPTATTEHSVKNSPWLNGKGDVVKMLREACDEYGLKLGLYLSPWDRNNAYYGQAKYVEIFHEQLNELLSNYGDLFEIWFDGANGGSGYYGGANETRKIDNKTYYQWDKVTAMIREKQPMACIFGDGGPDVRWVGNEEGWANETNWSTMNRDSIYPGWPKYIELRSGHENGSHWLPAEADVSIRPGWYYHSGEDHQVKTLPKLLDIYYHSVGRNASLLLNLPVDTRGLVHETDVERLQQLKNQLHKDFGQNLVKQLQITASDVRGKDDSYAATNVIDAKNTTFWATNDGVTQASLVLNFKHTTTFNRLVLQEYVPLGQRVERFSLWAKVDDAWKKIEEQTTIGYKRILRFPAVTSKEIKILFDAAKGPLTISNLELYHAPHVLVPPSIRRDKAGKVHLTLPDEKLPIYYTTNGREPSKNDNRYKAPFLAVNPTIVKAIAVDSETGQFSGVNTANFDIAKTDWKLLKGPAKKLVNTNVLFDGDPSTFWAGDKDFNGVQEIVVDLGRQYDLQGFTYWPNQERWYFGLISEYSFYVSTDQNNWKLAKKGEFSNIKNNRIQQRVQFNAMPARYIKLRANRILGEDPRASFAELGVLTN